MGPSWATSSAAAAGLPAGIALARLGRLDDQCAWNEQMLLTAGRTGDRALLGNAHIQRAMRALVRGELDEAKSAGDQSIAVRPDKLPSRSATAAFDIAVAAQLRPGR